MSIRSLPSSTNFVTEEDEDEPSGLCADSVDDDDLTDHSGSTTPLPKPITFAIKSIIPLSYAISFPPAETLFPMFPFHDEDDSTFPYDYSDLESADPDLIFGPSAINSASALKLGDNPLYLDHNGKPLTYKTALQGRNVANWIAANSAEFRRLIQKTKTLYPVMHDQLPPDRKFDTILPPKKKSAMIYVPFEFEE